MSLGCCRNVAFMRQNDPLQIHSRAWGRTQAFQLWSTVTFWQRLSPCPNFSQGPLSPAWLGSTLAFHLCSSKSSFGKNPAKSIWSECPSSIADHPQYLLRLSHLPPPLVTWDPRGLPSIHIMLSLFDKNPPHSCCAVLVMFYPLIASLLLTYKSPPSFLYLELSPISLSYRTTSL